MDEAGLTAELVAALNLDRPEHTADMLAMLATALSVEARRHRSRLPRRSPRCSPLTNSNSPSVRGSWPS